MRRNQHHSALEGLAVLTTIATVTGENTRRAEVKMNGAKKATCAYPHQRMFSKVSPKNISHDQRGYNGSTPIQKQNNGRGRS